MIDKLFLVFQLWHAFICILQIYICLNMCYIEVVFLALCNLVRNLICAKIGLNDFSLPKEDGKGCRNVQRLFCFFQNSLVYDNGYIFFILCHLDSSAFNLFKKVLHFLYVTKTWVFRLICILTFEFHYFLCLFYDMRTVSFIHVLQDWKIF